MGDVTSYFQQTHQGFLIEGSLIHISGDTVIDNGVVTADMIQAGAITADAIYQAGYRVKNITIITGVVNAPLGTHPVEDCTRLPIPDGYTPAQCVFCAYSTGNVNSFGNAVMMEDSDGYARVCVYPYNGVDPNVTNSMGIKYKVVGIK